MRSSRGSFLLPSGDGQVLLFFSPHVRALHQSGSVAAHLCRFFRLMGLKKVATGHAPHRLKLQLIFKFIVCCLLSIRTFTFPQSLSSEFLIRQRPAKESLLVSSMIKIKEHRGAAH
jgi:hypothetical protein